MKRFMPSIPWAPCTEWNSPPSGMIKLQSDRTEPGSGRQHRHRRVIDFDSTKGTIVKAIVISALLVSVLPGVIAAPPGTNPTNAPGTTPTTPVATPVAPPTVVAPDATTPGRTLPTP